MTPVIESLRAFKRELMRPTSTQPVSEWCAANVYLPPPQTQSEGWLRLDGREYLREFVDDFGEPQVHDEVACFGSQSGKTTALMAGVAWSLVEDPCGFLWVLPNFELAKSFSETRWIPMLMASPTIKRLVPTGTRRWKFKLAQQLIGAAVVNFIGSNSPANLASRPARRIILDEVDKFDEGGSTGEADAMNLAEQRTKSFGNPQRFKVSTPTMLNGLIWQEFLKGDQRRYFVPCLHCGREILFAWSKAFTVLPLQGVESFVCWDKEARRGKEWDINRVKSSARIECCHCGGHILDGHKTRMVRYGVWRPTTEAPEHFRSRQLSSLYASGPETSFGSLAVKFLQAKGSILGLQGFINGDLAEPYASQDTARERIELVTERSIAGADWPRLMTVDVQQNAPHFWYVIRAWNDGDSEAIAAGYTETWSTLEAVSKRHEVKPEAVLVDSAHDTETVYAECARRCDLIEGYDDDGRPTLHAVGWQPAKGLPAGAAWKDKEDVMRRIKDNTLVDPYEKTGERGDVVMRLFSFDGPYFKDVLSRLRSGAGGYRWTVSAAAASDEYWRHLDAEIKKEIVNRRTGRSRHEWVLRAERWPNHLLDCEVMQVAFAAWFGLFRAN